MGNSVVRSFDGFTQTAPPHPMNGSADPFRRENKGYYCDSELSKLISRMAGRLLGRLGSQND